VKCKACDKEGALWYDPPKDVYCEECLEVIFKTIGKEFTLGDVMEIVLGKDKPEDYIDV